MERRSRHALNTILGCVGYGLGYSEDHNVAVGDGRVENGPRADTAKVKAAPKRVVELGNWQSRPKATEVITEAPDGRRQLAGLREPAEQARAASLATVVEDVAGLCTQLAELRESAERDRDGTAVRINRVADEIADLRTQLAGLNESAEPGREATAARVEEVVEQSADLGRQWADLRQRIEQPGNGSDPELFARPEKPGRTASSQPETPSASTIERGGGPVSTVGRPPSSENPSAGFDGDRANASSFFRWPSLLAFPKVLATHMPRFLTRMGRQDTEDLSESVGRSPEHEVPVAVERLRGMVRSDTLDIAPVTVAFDEPPDDGGDGGSGTDERSP